METVVNSNGVELNVLRDMGTMGHEQVVFCHDEATGLKAIIGIHNTVLGPALGGTRMWHYANDAEALEDVLRLSRGMSFKAAIAGLNLGGGKAVIIGDSRTQKNEALLRRFGKFVDSLGGKYITAEDVGMGTKDMEYIRMETKHVTGMPEYLGGTGDPSPVTAYGVYMGMKASAKHVYGNDDLKGKTVLVQGCGHVGQHLVGYLVKEEAQVLVADIFEDNLNECTRKYPMVKVVAADKVYSTPMDIYAPCALGGTLNDETIEQLKCTIVAGAANNQLKAEKIHGRKLIEKGIVYAPDFLINSGGLINVYGEIMGYNTQAAIKKAEFIYGVTLEIFKYAKDNNITNGEAAIQYAQRRIDQIAKINSTL
jgi:leucine dehydrogenase